MEIQKIKALAPGYQVTFYIEESGVEGNIRFSNYCEGLNKIMTDFNKHLSYYLDEECFTTDIKLSGTKDIEMNIDFASWLNKKKIYAKINKLPFVAENNEHTHHIKKMWELFREFEKEFEEKFEAINSNQDRQLSLFAE